MDARRHARSLARKYVSERNPLGWFELLYAAAAGDPAAIPWADLKPNASLVGWLDRHPVPQGRSALTVGCGLGDDAGPELTQLTRGARLAEQSFEDYLDREDPPVRRFRAVYRPAT